MNTIPATRAVTVLAFIVVAAALLIALTSSGCAKKPPVPTAPPTESRPETRPEPVPDPPVEPVVARSGPELDELYERVGDSVIEFQSGIELLRAGQEVDGEDRIAVASERLRADAELCAANPFCDLEWVFDAYDLLLAEQGIALKTQAFRIETLEESAEQDVDREPGTSPFVAEIREIDRSVSLLRGTDLREIIELNGPVRAALDDWLTWLRPMLLDAYVNYQFLRDAVAPVYEEAGLPEALLFAMVATESGGKVHSFSRAGAAGPLQFMRYTGRRYGLTVIDGFDMRLDPESATRANVAYLNEHFELFNNSLEKALAAYNGGESRMERLHRKYGDTSLWDTRVYYSLPRETREYVPRVLAAAWLFLHPEEYDLEFPKVETAITRLTVEQEISISELTICLGQSHLESGWFRTLRNLNPRLGPGDRVEAGDEVVVPELVVPLYRERCLEGALLARARELHDANYPDEPEMIHYVVKRGDSLGRIASRFRCVSIGELAAINGVRPPRYVIRVGQTLKIPTCP